MQDVSFLFVMFKWLSQANHCSAGFNNELMWSRFLVWEDVFAAYTPFAGEPLCFLLVDQSCKKTQCSEGACTWAAWGERGCPVSQISTSQGCRQRKTAKAVRRRKARERGRDIWEEVLVRNGNHARWMERAGQSPACSSPGMGWLLFVCAHCSDLGAQLALLSEWKGQGCWCLQHSWAQAGSTGHRL